MKIYRVKGVDLGNETEEFTVIYKEDGSATWHTLGTTTYDSYSKADAKKRTEEAKYMRKYAEGTFGKVAS